MVGRHALDVKIGVRVPVPELNTINYEKSNYLVLYHFDNRH